MLPYNQDDYQENPAASDVRRSITLDDAIRRSCDLLLSLQHPDGYWWADHESDATFTSQTVLLCKILGIEDRHPLHKMGNYIRRTQRAHGGWEAFRGDGGCLSISIECYMALRLLNAPKTDPALQRALNFITSRGGITKSRIFTKICLALLGCYDWRGIPSLPPWLMLLPSWLPFSIYEMASWARGCVVPLTILFDKKPVFKVSPGLSFDELYSEGRKNAHCRLSFGGDWTSKFFVGVDYAFKVMERMGVVPFRQWGLKEAEKWILERQEDTGDYLGLHPGMLYSIVGMKLLGYELSDPVLHRTIVSLDAFARETNDECSVQSAISPMWDTVLAVRSLIDAGMKADHPSLQRAGEWLLKKQIIKQGDWSYKNPLGRAGGWAFQFVNRWYPDIDDSAAAVMALCGLKLSDEDVKNAAIARCVQWISSMQCKEGGWAAYDKDCDQAWLNHTPFADLKGMIDPNTVDITARVLEMVGMLKESSCDAVNHFPEEAVARGLAYLRRKQEKEGCWYGRWGVNYIYGTSGALLALSLVAPRELQKEEIEKGARWLVEVQNKNRGHRAGGGDGDGGWGETCWSYKDPALKGKGEASTPSQTAWALQGLLAAGDVLGKYEEEAIERGVEHLLSTQRKDGSWHEQHFTGCVLPCHIYIRYHLYAQHFPLSALSRCRNRLNTQKLHIRCKF